MRHNRPYRAAKIAAAAATVVPRYWVLLARDLVSWLPSSSDAEWLAVHERAADRIRRLAEELEGGLIKAAQIGGARADVMPKPFIDKLSKFHDSVPARPFAALRPIVEDELGRPLDDVFASVDPQPLGAASLAQVHRARLRDDTDVVIKIQYPEAHRVFPLDLAMMRRVAALVQPMQGAFDVTSIANEITHYIELELDFAREADSSRRLGAILAARGDVVVPRIYDEYSSRRVIVMQYIDGIKITEIAALQAAGHQLSAVGRRVGSLYGAMLFEYGFFHGDPHPGNILVLPDGRIGLLDFGLCKELPSDFAALVAEMIVAALIGDGPAAMRAAERLSFDMDEIDPDHLRSLILRLVGDHDNQENLGEVIAGTRIRNIPDDFGLVLRTMLLLNGLSHRLAPGRRLIQSELLKALAAAVERAKSAGAEQQRPDEYPAAVGD